MSTSSVEPVEPAAPVQGMGRWKAAGWHLLISAIAVGAVAALLIGLWYGWDLFLVLDAHRLLGILAAVHLVAGPLLTLIVYRAGKPSLRFDLTVIALLQTGFLVYGLHIMAQSRPVFVVGVLDQFEVVFANETDPFRLSLAPMEEVRALSWTGPLWVGGQMATDDREALQLTLDGAAGEDIHEKPERYIPLERVTLGIAQNGRQIDQLAEPARQRALALIARAGVAAEDARVVPLMSSRGEAAVLMDRRDGRVLGILRTVI